MLQFWEENNNKLARSFSFSDFKEALEFVNKVGKLAESENHHPDIFLNNYNNVQIMLTTHNAGHITEKDYKLAKDIDNLVIKNSEVLNTEVKIGRYRHYKHKDRKYEVIGIAKHSETLEEMVVYRALYGDRQIWVRPKQMFFGTVIINGKKVSRFEYIGE